MTRMELASAILTEYKSGRTGWLSDVRYSLGLTLDEYFLARGLLQDIAGRRFIQDIPAVKVKRLEWR